MIICSVVLFLQFAFLARFLARLLVVSLHVGVLPLSEIALLLLAALHLEIRISSAI